MPVVHVHNTTKYYKLVHRFPLACISYREGWAYGIKARNFVGNTSFTQAVSYGKTLRVKKQSSRPDYCLGFVLGFFPESVNMLTYSDLIVMGYLPEQVTLYTGMAP